MYEKAQLNPESRGHNIWGYASFRASVRRALRGGRLPIGGLSLEETVRLHDQAAGLEEERLAGELERLHRAAKTFRGEVA